MHYMLFRDQEFVLCSFSMNTLYVTAAERKVFNLLPEAVKEGWQVEAEDLTYADTRQKQMMRLSLVRLHDPSLLALREKALKMESVDEVVALIGTMNLTLVDGDDLAELSFALGPTMMSNLIAALLGKVTNDAEMEGVTALTVIRHAILRSLQPVS